jgi:hypothetical protein
MILRFAALLLLQFATANISSAQQANSDSSTKDPHEVQPERPTVATHAGTVAPGWIEIEVGGERDHYSDGDNTLSFPTVVKIGVFPRAQVNVIASALVGTVSNPSARGIGDVTLGLKYRLLDAATIVNDFAILPSVKFPSASVARGLGSGTTDVSLLLISSRSVGATDVDINLGATQHFGADANTPTISTLWTFSAGFPVTGRLGCAAEVYGFPGTAGPGGAKEIIAILAGPTWQPVKWLAADAGIIEPVKGPQPRAFYAGLVWNVGKIW